MYTNRIHNLSEYDLLRLYRNTTNNFERVKNNIHANNSSIRCSWNIRSVYLREVLYSNNQTQNIYMFCFHQLRPTCYELFPSSFYIKNIYFKIHLKIIWTLNQNSPSQYRQNSLPNVFFSQSEGAK